MELYTSYFANLRNIDKSIIPVSIARIKPSWYNGLEFKAIAPSMQLLKWYKYNNEYTQNEKERINTDIFKKEVFDRYTATAIYTSILRLTDGADKAVLLCYEKYGDFCHRHLVSDYLNKAGYPCNEIGVIK